VTADRYTIKVYRNGRRQGDPVDLNLDPTDDARCREVLEDLVKQRAGTLKLDLSQWSMDVHRLGGGMVRRTVSIDPSGRTVLKP
jgi:hypothetical protein